MYSSVPATVMLNGSRELLKYVLQQSAATGEDLVPCAKGLPKALHRECSVGIITFRKSIALVYL